jgi:exonuclease III
MNFGCWNVQGLTNKIQETPFELKTSILMWPYYLKPTGRGKEDFIDFWSGINKGKRAKAGVSIVINKKYKKCITNWNFINERNVSVELNIFGRRMSIVGVYAPTNSYPEKAKDQFWETLKDVLDRISSTSEIFLMGDFNKRVGKEEDDQIVGRFVGEEINNGERLKEVC